jgi:hypothetical protein
MGTLKKKKQFLRPLRIAVKNGLSPTKAKALVVWFFRQKKDCLSANQSGIEKL